MPFALKCLERVDVFSVDSRPRGCTIARDGANVLDGMSRLHVGLPGERRSPTKGRSWRTLAPAGEATQVPMVQGVERSLDVPLEPCPIHRTRSSTSRALTRTSGIWTDVIVTATACLAQRVFDNMKVKPSCVIADVARPLDLPASEVANRPDVLAIESGESGVALGPAQRRRGAFVTGSARPPRSTLTRSCDGPRHTLPAMTRAGSRRTHIRRRVLLSYCGHPQATVRR